MNKLEILNRELNYQVRVYKGKTKKYDELKRRLEFYQVVVLLLVINLKKQKL